MFESVQCELNRHGYLARGGQLIDASIVSAPVQHFNKEEKEIIEQEATPSDWTPSMRRQRDIETKWTKKHGKSYFGYRVSINVDARGKFIRKVAVSAANEADTRHFEDVLDPANTSKDVYADRGYVDGEREKRLNKEGYRMHIQRKAKPRARVEHAFGGMAAMGGKAVRGIGLKRAQIGLTLKSAVYNLRRLLSVNAVGLSSF